MKGDYEKFHALGRRENKANLMIQCTSQLDDTYTIWQCKVAVNAIQQFDTAYCKTDLKKQTQLFEGQNEHKASYNKELR